MGAMVKFLMVCFLGVATLVAGKNIMPTPDFQILPDNNTSEATFWKTLNADEKLWMLNSSVVVHLKKLENGTNSTQEMNMPLTLAPRFLNGEVIVPDKFQENAVTWIKEFLGVDKDEDLHVLVRGDELCGTESCSTYPGMGENCCPWG